MVDIFTSVELVASSGSQESDDGIGGEEGSMWGFEEWKSVEDRDVGKIGVGIVGNFLKLNLEGIGNGSDLSESAVGGALGAVVKLHCC